MKKELLFAAWMVALTLTACSSGDDLLQETTDTTETNNGETTDSSSHIITSPQLSSLSVAIDSTALDETESVPENDEDYVETFDAGHIINIVYNGSTATVNGSADGVSIAVNGADVSVTSTTAGVNYVLSGNTTLSIGRIRAVSPSYSLHRDCPSAAPTLSRWMGQM